jgi:hypothetical protein
MGQMIGSGRIDGGVMLLKTSGSIFLYGALLLCGPILSRPCKAGVELTSIARSEQRRTPQKVDAAAQILEYYRKFPDRYIRISEESWQYDEKSHCAYHSFTLKNTATLPYYGIEVRISYQTSSGKELKTEIVKIEGALPALGKLAMRNLKVKQVPPAAKIVATIAKAVVYQ